MPNQKEDNELFLFMMACILIPFLVFSFGCYLVERMVRSWEIKKEDAGWWISTIVGIVVLVGFLIVLGFHAK